MCKSKKNEEERLIFNYLKDYYKENFKNFKYFSDEGKKLESPDVQNEINDIGIEIVRVTVEEKEKRYSYFDNLCKGNVRNKSQYDDVIIHSTDEKPKGILGPIINGDLSFEWEKNLITTNLKTKLNKLPNYKHFKTNILLLKLDEYIDFRYVAESRFSINSNFKSWIKETEQNFKKVFDEYIFLSLIMKKIYIFRHDSNGDFIYTEEPLHLDNSIENFHMLYFDFHKLGNF